MRVPRTGPRRSAAAAARSDLLPSFRFKLFPLQISVRFGGKQWRLGSPRRLCGKRQRTPAVGVCRGVMFSGSKSAAVPMMGSVAAIGAARVAPASYPGSARDHCRLRSRHGRRAGGSSVVARGCRASAGMTRRRHETSAGMTRRVSSDGRSNGVSYQSVRRRATGITRPPRALRDRPRSGAAGPARARRRRIRRAFGPGRTCAGPPSRGWRPLVADAPRSVRVRSPDRGAAGRSAACPSSPAEAPTGPTPGSGMTSRPRPTDSGTASRA